MSSFEKFWKIVEDDCASYDNLDYYTFIRIEKSLGEWAWENGGLSFAKFLPKEFRIIDIAIRNAKAYRNPEKQTDYRFLIHEIDFEKRFNAIRFLEAVACLGKETIKKRLKELERKESEQYGKKSNGN